MSSILKNLHRIQISRLHPCGIQVGGRETETEEGAGRLVVQDLYAAAVGSPVAVEYIVRVFPFEKNGKTMYGNDVYATAIQPWQP